MPNSDYLEPTNDSESKGDDEADPEWIRVRDLIRAASNRDGEALTQLCREKLEPVVAQYGGDCPQALVDRFYKEGSDALTHLINTGGYRLQCAEWCAEAQRIQTTLASTLQAADHDWSYVKLIKKGGSVTAEDHLLRRYEARIRGVAYTFHDRYPEIVDDLAQEGLITFRDEVIPNYNPDRRVTLWEYARRIVWRDMRDASHEWAKPRLGAPLYRQVMAAAGRLRSKYKREPTYAEIAQECDVSTDDVREVMEIGRGRRESSLDSSWDDDETHPPEAEARGADPLTLVLRRAYYDAVVRRLNENSGKDADGHDGERWLVLFVLKYYEGYSWDEILAILLGDVDIDWPSVHEAYSLPYALPTEKAQICRLFQYGGPKLTVDNLKRWYARRTAFLEESLDEGDLEQ